MDHGDRKSLGRWARLLAQAFGRTRPFHSSQDYWEDRYAMGGTSGRGSSGELAAYKAEFLNRFVREHEITGVLELGCGDGSQLSLAEYPRYIGLDVARTAIKLCRARFERDRTKSFYLYDPEAFVDRHGLFRAELVLSLDVIYHLTEEPVFELYMQHLFDAAERFVIVYSSNIDCADREPHIRHREFTRWVEAKRAGWRLVRRAANPFPVSADQRSGSFADFFVFEAG